MSDKEPVYCHECGLADDITDRCTIAEDKAHRLRAILAKLLKSEEAYGTEGNKLWDEAREAMSEN